MKKDMMGQMGIKEGAILCRDLTPIVKEMGEGCLGWYGISKETWESLRAGDKLELYYCTNCGNSHSNVRKKSD